MKKYMGIVKIKGHYVQTVLFADSALHAKLLFEYHYGFDCLINTPKQLQEANQTLQPTIITSPKANLKPSISFKQQKHSVQKKKMAALVQQQANNELKQQSKTTPLDIAASLIMLGDIKQQNQP